MKIESNLTLASLSLWVLTCAGCSALGGSDDTVDLRTLAHDLWSVQSAEVENEEEYRRVAVVEFTVEYADGLDLGTGVKMELPGILYRKLVRTLPEFDFHPISLVDVSSSLAYAQLEGTGIFDEGVDMSTTTGYTVDGLRALSSDQAGQDTTLFALLEEVRADFALRVNLKIGVRDGRASIEKGSTFRSVAPEGSGTLEMKRALVSAATVVAPESVTTDDEPDAIVSAKFVHAVERLFSPALSLALIAAGRAD